MRQLQNTQIANTSNVDSDGTAALNHTNECHSEKEKKMSKDSECSAIDNDEVVYGMCVTMLSTQDIL